MHTELVDGAGHLISIVADTRLPMLGTPSHTGTFEWLSRTKERDEHSLGESIGLNGYSLASGDTALGVGCHLSCSSRPWVKPQNLMRILVCHSSGSI